MGSKFLIIKSFSVAFLGDLMTRPIWSSASPCLTSLEIAFVSTLLPKTDLGFSQRLDGSFLRYTLMTV